MSATTSSPPGRAPGSDDLSLIVGGMAFSGWDTLRVTRGVERMPGDFEISVTERYPGAASEVVVQPGQSCVIKLGSDVVLTGYVDSYAPSVSARAHTVRVAGRGKCQDLTDCSAIVQGMAITTGSALDLATKLAAPFNITASSPLGAVSVATPNGSPVQFNVNLGETPMEIIGRIARYAQVLAYEGTDGNLILDRVGSTSMASGFSLGANVEAAAAAFSMAARFTDYTAVWMSADKLSDLGGNGNTHAYLKDPDFKPYRYRPLIVVSDQSSNGVDLAQAKLVWQMNRRNGRAQQVKITCDSWRDSAGTLWAPNALAPLNLPALKLVGQTWVIGEVSYRRGADGTHADLTLMPPGAYSPEPTALQGSDWQVSQALPGGGAAAPGAAGSQMLGRI